MIALRALHIEELEDWFNHCTTVFNVPKDYFVRHWYNDPWRDISSILVAVDGEKIVSTVRVMIREIYIDGKPFSMGGIGEVSTKPDYQRRGLTGQLLAEALVLMRERGIKISYLSAGLHAFYQKHGWRNTVRKRIEADFKGITDSKFTVRNVDWARDFLSVKKIYQEYSSKLNGVLVRNDEYWEKWVAAETEVSLVAVDVDGAVIAYAGLKKDESCTVIQEAGALAGFEDALTVLVSYAAVNGSEGSRIRYPEVLGLNIGENITWENDFNKMYQLVSPIEIFGRTVSTTEEFISVIENKYYFWDTDGF